RSNPRRSSNNGAVEARGRNRTSAIGRGDDLCCGFGPDAGSESRTRGQDGDAGAARGRDIFRTGPVGSLTNVEERLFRAASCLLKRLKSELKSQLRASLIDAAINGRSSTNTSPPGALPCSP